MGVNIGGWLVLEPWITPSIFQQFPGHTVVDEWTLCEIYPDQAPGILKKHWDSWVSLADFQKIAENGFNLVRIPIGYWAYQKFDDPYIKGAAPYIDLAIGWARQTGLKVLIDLHGGPGSQNGYDNSGHNGTIGWSASGNSVADTRVVIQQIAAQYAQPSYQDVVVGIELLNEPLASKLAGGTDAVVQYYKGGYGDVRNISDTPVVVHDAFQQGTFWDGVLTTPDAQGVIIDHHEYQVFTEELIALSPEEHVLRVCTNSGTYAANVNHWVIVGEWSAAMTDCAAALNGYGVGSRWEGSYFGNKGATGRSCGDINFVESWNLTIVEQTKRYIEAQLDVYTQQTKGFIFWNFKTEASAEWDLFRLLDHPEKIFPNLKGRMMSSVCS
ncbi:MAG: hypothetical protein Q9217_000156 [Psora testacea]